ncbi:MAG TPA: L,D-transpeptidase [Solirubrobacteraceae bacterium]|nr:L,D-transpeptidase [Solirubrobacteraceae bacterium]
MRTAALAACCLLLVPAAAQAAQAPGAPQIARQQQIVTLLEDKSVRVRPGAGEVLTSVSGARPITGARTTLPVFAEAQDAGGERWLLVRLPGRSLKRSVSPRGGWISAANTRSTRTVWHVLIDRDARQVRVYRRGLRLRSYRAIVGARSTPTPRGAYFVEESLRLPATAAGAPFALATSARSSVLQEFAGGPGQIALHGVDNLGGRLGTAVSHGCVRLSRAAITWLASHMRPGVPVTIV